MFEGRQIVRAMDTLARIQAVVIVLVGRRLMYRDLIADADRSPAAT